MPPIYGKSAKGKGAKGKGEAKGAVVRRRKAFNAAQCQPGKSALRRLARRAGIVRIAQDVYPSINQLLIGFVANRLNAATAYCEISHRKTLALRDILLALRRFGRPLLWDGGRSGKKHDNLGDRKLKTFESSRR